MADEYYVNFQQQSIQVDTIGFEQVGVSLCKVICHRVEMSHLQKVPCPIVRKEHKKKYGKDYLTFSQSNNNFKL